MPLISADMYVMGCHIFVSNNTCLYLKFNSCILDGIV